MIVRKKQQLQGGVIPQRGKIKKMSNRAISRLIFTANASSVEFNVMATFTYPAAYPLNGKIVKADIGYFVQWLRKAFGTEYLWFLEFQTRGAPHFHVLINLEGLSPYIRAEVGLRWVSRIATSEWFIDWLQIEQSLKKLNARQILSREVSKMARVATRLETMELLREPKAGRKYVTKYAAKAIQKRVPKKYQDVGRFWGCSKAVIPVCEVEVDVTDDEVREWLAKQDHATANWEVLPRYLFNLQRVGDKA
mgnify:CR=1 FL=1